MKKKKKQPKTVKAWAFSYGQTKWTNVEVHSRKSALVTYRRSYKSYWKCAVGPIVRIEVPAPKATP